MERGVSGGGSMSQIGTVLFDSLHTMGQKEPSHLAIKKGDIRCMVSPRKLKFLAEKNETVNMRFRTWLKVNADPDDLDRRFLRLHKELFADYDCSRCRNCCKEYIGSIPEADLERDAAGLNMSVEEFTCKYLNMERGLDDGAYCAKGYPCSFLQNDGECLMGENKPENCVKYPYTDQPDRMGSLFSMLDTISICPVAYEIWERLKAEYRFRA